MTYEQLLLEAQQILRDPTVDEVLRSWLNDVMTEMSGQYELPTLRLRVPATLTTTTANYLYDLSAATHVSGYVYQKRLFRVTSSTFQQGFGLEPDPTWIEDVDPTHATIGDSVQRVAVEGDQLLVFPKANDTLSLWFYRKPVPMVNPGDSPDGIPEPYHFRVLMPAVVLRAFRVYPELISEVMGDNTKALALWTARLSAGLYGDGTQEGLLHFINKSQRVGTPRVRGPARGSSLGGRW